MTKDNNNALKQKCPSSWWHAWHKSEYHGDGDVDGARHKIGNVGVIDVDGPLHKIGKCECNWCRWTKGMLCKEEDRGPGGYGNEEKDDLMVMCQ
jgi:hypothetical protein